MTCLLLVRPGYMRLGFDTIPVRRCMCLDTIRADVDGGVGAGGDKRHVMRMLASQWTAMREASKKLVAA